MRFKIFLEYRASIRFVIILITIVTLLFSCQNDKNVRFDIIIKNGTVIDGTGKSIEVCDI